MHICVAGARSIRVVACLDCIVVAAMCAARMNEANQSSGLLRGAVIDVRFISLVADIGIIMRTRHCRIRSKEFVWISHRCNIAMLQIIGPFNSNFLVIVDFFFIL